MRLTEMSFIFKFHIIHNSTPIINLSSNERLNDASTLIKLSKLHKTLN